jgi:predicted Zn-dependent protease
MESLDATTRLALRSADGWLKLGNPAQAQAELDRLEASAREHPDALQIRWTLAARRSAWTECLQLAERLTQQTPDRWFGWLHLAESLHRLGRTAEAYERLLTVAGDFESNPTLPFFLARFAVALGRPNDARRWLRQARVSAENRGAAAELRRRLEDEPTLLALSRELDGA